MIRTCAIVCLAVLLAAASTRDATAASTPYAGTPVSLPGRVEAENYDNGGEGGAYYDTTPGNSGGAYRSDDVDIEASSEGGYDVGWIAAGEWANYTVSVAAAGAYSAQLRVASPSGGGSLHIGFNGPSNVWISVPIPATGTWQTWTTVNVPVTLGAGVQQMTLLYDAPGFNIDYVAVVGSTGGSSSGSSGLSSYLGAPVSLPGRIEAENYDNGGEGVAYYDTTPGNAGGAYRSDDVDIQTSSEGGYNVGWIAAGEWANYTVSVPSAGAYTAELRVASPSGGGSLHIGFNGPSNVWISVPVPATGDWQTWTTVEVPVTLGAGVQQMTLLYDAPGFNIDYVDVAGAASSSSGGTSSGGATINVPAGGDLQAAIESAQPGDTILLAPGATYAGSFVLSAKSGSGYVTIRSGAPDSSLPPAGSRVTPAYASELAQIQGGAAGAPAFVTEPGAHGYQLQFLEIVSTYAANDLIELGDGSSQQNTLSQVPYDLIVDRCYIHGDPTNGQKRGISLNSGSTTITGSYISDIKSSTEDAQAIAGWNGPGPYTITNNYLEASGENVLFGGADPSIPSLVPSNITLQRNYISKPTAWMSQGWTVKDLVELKNAQQVTIDSNLIENSWAAAQQGYAIVLTPRNQNGTAPWSVVQQVQVTNNIVRHVAAVFNVLGTDYDNPSQLTNTITIRNNLFYDVSSGNWGGNAWFLLLEGGDTITVDHNTLFSDGTSDVYMDSTQTTNVTFTNNIVPDNEWAVMGGGTAPGNASIAAYLPGAAFTDNVFIAGNIATYPANNYYPPDQATVQFNPDDSLASSSPYISAATDGTAVGVNIGALSNVPHQ